MNAFLIISILLLIVLVIILILAVGKLGDTILHVDRCISNGTRGLSSVFNAVDKINEHSNAIKANHFDFNKEIDRILTLLNSIYSKLNYITNLENSNKDALKQMKSMLSQNQLNRRNSSNVSGRPQNADRQPKTGQNQQSNGNRQGNSNIQK